MDFGSFCLFFPIPFANLLINKAPLNFLLVKDPTKNYIPYLPVCKLSCPTISLIKAIDVSVFVFWYFSCP